MASLNNLAYVMQKDKLIYDAKHPVDAKAVPVTITADNNGILRRGQLIDCENGVYGIHAAGGTPCVIVAEDTEYLSTDTEVVTTVYTSGTFRTSEIVSGMEITVEEIEALRGKGIYLK